MNGAGRGGTGDGGGRTSSEAFSVIWKRGSGVDRRLRMSLLVLLLSRGMQRRRGGRVGMSSGGITYAQIIWLRNKLGRLGSGPGFYHRRVCIGFPPTFILVGEVDAGGRFLRGRLEHEIRFVF